jgi:hypothetical protein
MDDLDLLREHLPETPDPSDNAKRRASARLAQAIADETRRPTARDDNQTLATRLLRLIRSRPRPIALACATVVAAAAAALFVSAPWKNPPGFLERAEAALSQAGILHMKMQTTSTWTRASCTVTYSQAEVWIDETPPNTYRVLLNDLPPEAVKADPRTRTCFSGRASELGGTYDSLGALRFIPPNKLTRTEFTSSYAIQLRFPLNPAADLREAIRAGRAHDEGKTELDGRTVERIRIDPLCPPRFTDCQLPRDLYIYVDPETFHPVQFVGTTSQGEIAGGSKHSSYSHVRVRDATRYLTFEYLPRTAANLALANIRAQHPNATGP